MALQNKSLQKGLCGVYLQRVNKNNQTSDIFIDFHEVFYIVGHNLLVSKLKRLGIRRVARNWFKIT